ncbi:cytidine deaminase-like fold-containing protein [Snodgrassella alvi]
MKVTGIDVCGYCQKDIVAMAKASKIFEETKKTIKCIE